MKPLIEISVEQYESLLKYASDTSPLYTRLKNSVKTEANTVPRYATKTELRCFGKRQNILVPRLYLKSKKRSEWLKFPHSGNQAMLLRDHPLMSYKGNRSWSPAWLWTAGYDNTQPFREPA